MTHLRDSNLLLHPGIIRLDGLNVNGGVLQVRLGNVKLTLGDIKV